MICSYPYMSKKHLNSSKIEINIFKPHIQEYCISEFHSFQCKQIKIYIFVFEFIYFY